MNSPPPVSGHPPSRARSNPFLSTLRALVLLGATGLYYLAYRVARLGARQKTDRLKVDAIWTQRWSRAMLWGGGIDIRLVGDPPAPGTMLVPNHVGYLDIIAIASVVPCFFVSRADVGSWPLIGMLLKSTGHLLHHRGTSRRLLGTAEEIRTRLEAGTSICVFLEGTTTPGDRLLPFKAALVQAAIGAGTTLTPTGLRWKAAHPGISVGDDISWWRDDYPFQSHLWRLLGLRGVGAEIEFGRPIEVTGRDRKQIAAEARLAVARLTGLEAELGEEVLSATS